MSPEIIPIQASFAVHWMISISLEDQDPGECFIPYMSLDPGKAHEHPPHPSDRRTRHSACG